MMSLIISNSGKISVLKLLVQNIGGDVQNAMAIDFVTIPFPVRIMIIIIIMLSRIVFLNLHIVYLGSYLPSVNEKIRIIKLKFFGHFCQHNILEGRSWIGSCRLLTGSKIPILKVLNDYVYLKLIIIIQINISIIIS